MDERALRAQLSRLQDWKDSHATFDRAVEGVPADRRGAVPAGLPYSPWQILEHLRIAQRDILEFCTDSDYKERDWPDDYWPKTPAPPSDGAWDDSIRQFRADRAEIQRLAQDPAIDLTSRIPHGQGQTYLREIVLVADHNAYHVGELIVIRRLLGIWPPS